jgi:hypothetical protein
VTTSGGHGCIGTEKTQFIMVLVDRCFTKLRKNTFPLLVTYGTKCQPVNCLFSSFILSRPPLCVKTSITSYIYSLSHPERGRLARSAPWHAGLVGLGAPGRSDRHVRLPPDHMTCSLGLVPLARSGGRLGNDCEARSLSPLLARMPTWWHERTEGECGEEMDRGKGKGTLRCPLSLRQWDMFLKD